MDTTTKEPVTVGGWYENTDGTVSHYSWHGGQLTLDATVPGWAAVPSDEERLADDRGQRAGAAGSHRGLR